MEEAYGEGNGVGFEMKLLDHGYVKLVDVWGSDQRIIEAARMSTGKGFLGWGPGPCPLCVELPAPNPDCHICNGTGSHKGDVKLLSYLWKNNHATPFEFGGAVFEIQAPIFVFREWHRHRTQSYNEASARYEPLPDLNYIPTVERLMINAGGTNKQAGTTKDAAVLTVEEAENFRTALGVLYEATEFGYQVALQRGIPKELARLQLPVGRYSKMRAHANMRNWMGFLTLRQAPNAQYEIRMYANAVHDMLKPLFPRTLALFDEGRG